jgi:hypothetical protein
MAKRGPKIADKWYPESDDEKHPKSGETFPKFSRAEIIFAQPGMASTVVDMAKLRAEQPDIYAQAACHGILQKLGDSYASVLGDFAKAKDNVEGVLELLLVGEWAKEREAGPRLKDLYDAIRRVMKDSGHTDEITDETLDAKYKTHPEAAKNRANAKATPAVQSKLAEIEVEKANARLTALRESQGQATAPATTPTDLI